MDCHSSSEKKLVGPSYRIFKKYVQGKKVVKIISWNVNGIRSVTKKGFVEWFTRTSPDILCIQETRAALDQFPVELINTPDYSLSSAVAEKKGYSGVATWSREKILDTNFLKKISFDIEGRTLIHEFESFYLVNAYFPNGQRDHARVPYKMDYCFEVKKKILGLQKKKPVILTGDLNTAHHPIDLANPVANKKTTGFLLEERAFLDELQSIGMVDIFRKLFPTLKDQYTWWSNRAGCREKNIGWRIDYFFVDQRLEKKVKSAEILSEVLGSDHCPILIEGDF